MVGQQSLIYSFVARGTVILAEYTEFTGNFTSIAAQCLQKLPASNNKFTYNCDGHTFNYLVENGFSEFSFDVGSRLVSADLFLCDLRVWPFDFVGMGVFLCVLTIEAADLLFDLWYNLFLNFIALFFDCLYKMHLDMP